MHLACIWSGRSEVNLLRLPVVEAGKIPKTWDDETAKQHCQPESIVFTCDQPKSQDEPRDVSMISSANFQCDII
jgi:hypothetical protein